MFQNAELSINDYWRSIILLGKNTSTYKFALAESLLEAARDGKSELQFDELSILYSKHLCRHLKKSPKQITSNNVGTFIRACQDYNNGKINHDQLIEITINNGYNHVIDRFHSVNRANLPIQFYDKTKNGIVLTDDIFSLIEEEFSSNLDVEVEARWKLIETAWELGISKNLLYDDGRQIIVMENTCRRKDVTSARSALNGYQQGKCFYCGEDIIVSDDENNDCEVDHFFPHRLQSLMLNINFDGVWNLVLACQKCNRGVNGKFDSLPAFEYLQRLYLRNEYFIESHNPISETIKKQTGLTERERARYLNSVYNEAKNILIMEWKTAQIGENKLDLHK